MTDTCGRTKRDGSGDPCGLPAGWGTDHVGEGACKLHGGNNGRGEDAANYKHGAWSEYADYDDDVVESVESVEDDLAVLEELRDERLAQYYTILQHLSENEGVEVAEKIIDQIDAGQEVDSDLVGRLARVMQVSSQSMDNLIARVQSLTNDIADRRGEYPRKSEEEVSLESEAMERLSESISDAYGDS